MPSSEPTRSTGSRNASREPASSTAWESVICEDHTCRLRIGFGRAVAFRSRKRAIPLITVDPLELIIWRNEKRTQKTRWGESFRKTSCARREGIASDYELLQRSAWIQWLCDNVPLRSSPTRPEPWDQQFLSVNNSASPGRTPVVTYNRKRCLAAFFEVMRKGPTII